jgi:acyl carrier protein
MLGARLQGCGTHQTPGEFTDRMSDIAREVVAQIAVILREDPQNIVPEARLAHDLGADSLDSVALVMTLEDRFAIDMPDEEVGELRTVRQLIEYVELAVAIKQRSQEERHGAGASAPRHMPTDG